MDATTGKKTRERPSLRSVLRPHSWPSTVGCVSPDCLFVLDSALAVAGAVHVPKETLRISFFDRDRESLEFSHECSCEWIDVAC